VWVDLTDPENESGKTVTDRFRLVGAKEWLLRLRRAFSKGKDGIMPRFNLTDR